MNLDRSAARRTTRRRFVGGALGTAATVALGGQTTAAPPPASVAFSAPRRQGSGVTLEVWGGVPAENGPAALIAAFQEANPDVAVNYTRYVNDNTGNTQLDTALQGGTPIDVYFTYFVTRMAPRIAAGVAADLTPYVTADAELRQWAESTEGVYRQDGLFYSLPTTREPEFVFANRRILDEAGASLPEQAAWTVDDFRALANDLSREDERYGSYAPPELARQILGPDHYYKAGGTESNFDNPAFRQWIELHRAMIEEGSAFPWSEVLAQDLRAYAQNPFLTEQVGLWVSSTFSLRYVSDTEEYPHDFVTTFAPLPAPVGQSEFFNTGGLNNWIMMTERSASKDAAWTFMRYWMTDGAVHMLPGGKIPAYPGVEPDTIVEGILGPDRDSLYDVAAFRRVALDSSQPLVTDTVTTAIGEIEQIVQQQTDRYLIGEIGVDEWTTATKEQADAAIRAASS